MAEHLYTVKKHDVDMHKGLNFSILFFLVVFSMLSLISNGQDLLRNYNLREINVDRLTDDEIRKFQEQLRTSGITQASAEQLAIAKGMPLSEIEKLRQRLLKLKAKREITTNTPTDQSLNQNQGQNRIDTTIHIDTSKSVTPLINPKIFGSELFNNASLTFEPNLELATPLNYVLGPNDELEISVYGLQEVTHSLTVSSEGSISIPSVGQIKVAGLSIEAATERIRSTMSKTAYSSLRNGSSKLSVAVGRIRSIRVTIIGSNRPGNYTLSSLSTVFNALFICGGPSQFGSFREIELIRNNTLYKKIDLYRFLVNGDQTDNVALQDNDVIRIPAYNTRIEIEGYVKRPGIFEVLPNETLADVLKFCSGFTDSAYRASVRVTQFTEKELNVKDINANNYNSYQPKPGDKVTVSKILNRYVNRVKISGAVFREGTYELTPGMTVADLIKKADGLREDAYTGRGQIFRLKEDLSKEMVSFNVRNFNKEVIPLIREDSIVVKSIFDLKNNYYLSIQGEVRNPGYYEYNDSLTLKDLILQAGGLTDAAYPQKIEIARIIRRDTLTSMDVRYSDIIDINGVNDLANQLNNVQLKPFDVVTIRRKPGFLDLESVAVSGEMQYPGPYVLKKREERVSDLIKRAGGFTPEAYIEGAYLKRYNFDETNREIRKQTINKIQEQFNPLCISTSCFLTVYKCSAM